MEDTKLRKLIREKVYQFLTEKKVLAEAEKEGKGKPTSGMTKEKVGTTHTEKTKSKNPPAKKVTDGGPENKTLTTAEPTKVESENKEKKEPDNTEFADRGKYVKEGSGYETECMGIELKVKGNSYADINHLYLLAQIRKSLEGRGESVKKVTIEMGEKEKEEVKESKQIKDIRNKIREIVVKELKKKSLNEGRNNIDDKLEDLLDDKTLVTDLMSKLPGRLVSFGQAKTDLTLLSYRGTIMGETHYDISVDDFMNYCMENELIRPGKEEEFKNRLNTIVGINEQTSRLGEMGQHDIAVKKLEDFTSEEFEKLARAIRMKYHNKETLKDIEDYCIANGITDTPEYTYMDFSNDRL